MGRRRGEGGRPGTFAASEASRAATSRVFGSPSSTHAFGGAHTASNVPERGTAGRLIDDATRASEAARRRGTPRAHGRAARAHERAAAVSMHGSEDAGHHTTMAGHHRNEAAKIRSASRPGFRGTIIADVTPHDHAMAAASAGAQHGQGTGHHHAGWRKRQGR